MLRFKHFLIAAAVAVLAACESPVPLDQAPVEDAKTNTVTTETSNLGTSAGTGGSGVTGQELGNANQNQNQNQAGPAGVEQVVYFDYDSYVIKPQYRSVIEAHARFLKADSKRRVNIAGHTDERGGREYNLALGQKRAEAVRQALNLLGVRDIQIEAVSYGKEKPIALGHSENDMAMNRRAEMSYSSL